MPKAQGIIAGLQIFVRHDPEMWINAEHDIIYGPDEYEVQLADDERAQLEALGWFVESASGSWAAFV